MKRFIGALAAIPLLLSLLVLAPQPAYAAGCGNNGTWQQIGYNAGSHTDPFGNQFDTDITAWQDGCGYIQYRYSLWSPTGTAWGSSPPLGIGGRIWVCGTLSVQFHVYATVSWSGWMYYGGCGQQTDNAFGAGNYGTHGCGPYTCYDSGIDYPYAWYRSLG